MASSQSPSEEGRSPYEESLSVLLIEDNPGDACLFEEYLEECGPEFDLRRAPALEAGLEALRKERSDVLVVDLGHPDSERAETVKAVAGAAPEVPIVVLTGQEGLEDAFQAQEAGAVEYLQKEDLTPGLVGRTLRWAVERSRMRAKLRQRDAWIRSISENVAGGLFRTGPTGRIEYANRALVEMLGFEEEAQPHIFEAFKQESEGIAREFEGTGVGLSIVRRMTEAMKGTIGVESEKGVGACFTVQLPKRPEAREEEE